MINQNNLRMQEVANYSTMAVYKTIHYFTTIGSNLKDNLVSTSKRVELPKAQFWGIFCSQQITNNLRTTTQATLSSNCYNPVDFLHHQIETINLCQFSTTKYTNAIFKQDKADT